MFCLTRGNLMQKVEVLKWIWAANVKVKLIISGGMLHKFDGDE